MSDPIDVDFDDAPAWRKCACPCCQNAADVGDWCSYCVDLCALAVAQAHRTGVAPSTAEAAVSIARANAFAKVGAPIARRATSAVIDALTGRRTKGRRK